MILNDQLRTLVARLQGSHAPPTRRQLASLGAAAVAILAARLAGDDGAARARRRDRRDVAGRAGPSGKPKKRRCGSSKQRCGGKCVNVLTDRKHCGRCNNACPGPIRCIDGICSPQFVRSWGQYGDDLDEFLYPAGITETPDGTLIIADSSNHRIKHFTKDGEPLGAWGVPGPGSSSDPTYTLNSPRGVAVTTKLPSGLSTARGWGVYVVDHGHHRIKLVDLDKSMWLRQFGDTAGNAPGWFTYPNGVAIAPNGRVYVVDGTNHRIQSWTRHGTAEGYFSWGVLGDGPGEFNYPQAVAVAPDGEVYVLDYNNRRVQVFSPDGRHRREWGSRGTDPGQFEEPMGIAVSRDRRVWVMDAVRDQVIVFDHKGRYLLSWGEFGDGPGQFNYPRHLAVTDEGIFVVDSGNNRIQQFR